MQPSGIDNGGVEAGDAPSDTIQALATAAASVGKEPPGEAEQPVSYGELGAGKGAPMSRKGEAEVQGREEEARHQLGLEGAAKRSKSGGKAAGKAGSDPSEGNK